LDLVLYGASSFVGKLVARHLSEREQATGLRWALAGRSLAALERVRNSLGEGAKSLPLMVADARDSQALLRMAGQTKVVLSCVGPYALLGSDLVAACTATGTDYCDLTGEPQWVAQMIAQHGPRASTSGARIVHCCGFDSVPSDLGVWLVQQEAIRRTGVPCLEIDTRVLTIKGGVSGGTVASMLNVLEQAVRDKSLRALLMNPYALCSDRPDAARVAQHDVRLPEFDAALGQWCAPFVMASVNSKVVMRSHALMHPATSLRYTEAMAMGPGPVGFGKASALAGALGGFVVAGAVPPSRWALKTFVVPKPGQGPSAEQQRAGRFAFLLRGKPNHGEAVTVKFMGDRDPGYGATARMVGEAALSLVFDRLQKKREGGFFTPASLMGASLMERLQAHAGIRVLIEPIE
jgi:short subunit dehydrogenase-like uncharacterized protein